MPRQYKRNIGCRKYRDFTNEQLQKAIARVRRGQSIRKVTEQYHIPKSTLNRHLRGKQTSKYGRPCVFTRSYNIRLIVKSFVDRRGMTERRFNYNSPGPDWFSSFFSRHHDRLTQRLSQNIKRTRAGVDRDIINNYFEKLATTIEGNDPALIMNYDETNMTDDPKKNANCWVSAIKQKEMKIDLPPGKSLVEGMLKAEEEPGPSEQIKRKKITRHNRIEYREEEETENNDYFEREFEVTIMEHTNHETDIEPTNNETQTDKESTSNETDIEPCNNETDIGAESNTSTNAVCLGNLEVDQFALVEYIHNQNTKKE
ncbi:hypothetical protein JTB14_031281 [Gonioctena quinquepunctata]|nr:hypothetical protein JTB14_031281 [Gonioctena quinquepunctata]